MIKMVMMMIMMMMVMNGDDDDHEHKLKHVINLTIFIVGNGYLKNMYLKSDFFFFFFFSGLCWGKAMVTYTKPQQRKKEESEQLRG